MLGSTESELFFSPQIMNAEGKAGRKGTEESLYPSSEMLL